MRSFIIFIFFAQTAFGAETVKSVDDCIAAATPVRTSSTSIFSDGPQRDSVDHDLEILREGLLLNPRAHAQQVLPALSSLLSSNAQKIALLDFIADHPEVTERVAAEAVNESTYMHLLPKILRAEGIVFGPKHPGLRVFLSAYFSRIITAPTYRDGADVVEAAIIEYECERYFAWMGDKEAVAEFIGYRSAFRKKILAFDRNFERPRLPRNLAALWRVEEHIRPHDVIHEAYRIATDVDFADTNPFASDPQIAQDIEPQSPRFTGAVGTPTLIGESRTGARIFVAVKPFVADGKVQIFNATGDGKSLQVTSRLLRLRGIGEAGLRSYVEGLLAR